MEQDEKGRRELQPTGDFYNYIKAHKRVSLEWSGESVGKNVYFFLKWESLWKKVSLFQERERIRVLNS